MIATRPLTSPTTLIGGLAFPTKGGKAAPTVVTRLEKADETLDGGGEALPVEICVNKYMEKQKNLK